MRRAILHVGTPRTGTTSLQFALNRLRAPLAARGVLYPDLTPASAPEPHLNHQYLGETLDGRRPAREWRELLDALDRQLSATGADTILLSYETLCHIPWWRLAPFRLRRALETRGFAVQPLLTIKPQAEMLNSLYTWRCQFLREKRPFRAYLRSGLSDARLDLLRLMRPWISRGGLPPLALPTRDARDPSPLLRRFVAEAGLLDRAGDLLDTALLETRENTSPGPYAVEVCRLLRAEGAHIALGPRRREASRLAERLARERGLDRAPFNGLDAALVAPIRDRFAAGNEAFAERVWGASWSSRVEEAPLRPLNEAAPTPELAALLRDCRTAFALGPG